MTSRLLKSEKLLGVVCHPLTRIWYSLPVCHIWHF